MKYLWRGITLRSWGLPVLIFVLVDGFVIFTDLRWVGEFRWSMEWANAGLFLAGSILALLTCIISNPLFSVDFRRIAGGNETPGTLRLLCSVTLRNLFLGLFGHFVVIVVAVGISAAYGASDTLLWQPFVYPLIPIVIFTILGTLFSAYSPTIFSAVTALGFSYIVSFGAASYTLLLPTNIGGLNVSMVGLQYEDLVLRDYLLLGALIGAVLIIGVYFVLRTRRTASGLVVLGVVLVAAFIGPSASGFLLADRVGPILSSPTTHCAGNSPKICVFDGHTRNLTKIAAGVHDAAQALEGAGIDMTSVVLQEELPFRQSEITGVLLLPSSYLNAAEFTTLDYANSLTRPADCDQYYGVDSSQQADLLATASALGVWIENRHEESVVSDGQTDEWARLAFNSLADCEPNSEVMGEIR